MSRENIKKIAIYIGGISGFEGIHTFFTRNKSQLIDVGLHYITDPTATTLYTQDAFYFLHDSALESQESLNKSINFIIAQIESVNYTQDDNILVISCPSFWAYMDAFWNFANSLKNEMPHIECLVFFNFSPQYLEVESYASYMSFFYSFNPSDYLLWFSSDDYSQYRKKTLLKCVHELQEKAIFRIHIMQDKHGTMDVLVDFLDFLGYDLQRLQAQGLDISPPSYIFSQLHPDFIHASFCFSRMLDAKLYKQCIVPWSTQAHRFMPDKYLYSKTSSLYGPDVHKTIYALYEEFNQRLFLDVGIRKMTFPYPPEEADWQPKNYIIEDVIHKVLQNMDAICRQDIIQNVKLNKFPSTFLYYRFLQNIENVNNVVIHTIPKLAVLTLACEHENFIAHCIESVLMQKTTFPVVHYIAVDFSNDATADIVARYARQYSSIVPIYFSQKSGGRNVYELFNECRSEFVALCDGDDYFTDPHKLQKQVDFLEAHPDYALCFHPVHVVYEDGTNRERFYPPLDELPRGVREFYYLADLLKRNLIQTNSVMYRWRFKDGLLDWFRSDLVPGDWYWHLLHAENGKIGFMNEVMSVYRRHRASLYYTSEIYGGLVDHRFIHGMKEIELYDVVNKHFKERYKRDLNKLASDVLWSFLLIAIEKEDDTLLKIAEEKYPEFTEYFYSNVKISTDGIIERIN